MALRRGLVGERGSASTRSSVPLDDIHDVNDHGIRTLMDAHRWGGQTFHASGWNPRHIEGVEHFFFYNLEKRTGRHFIHGQPVGLGIVLGSVMHGVGADEMVAALARAGVDIRPKPWASPGRTPRPRCGPRDVRTRGGSLAFDRR
jgi:glycerol dehydrogenase-like iron-containing ADH family enzyme